MNLNNTIDFESFYFVSLLEMINKQGAEKLDASMRQSLSSFVEFLSAEETPLENIEKLARLEGTSDMSIFFSDLLERIKQSIPDKIMDRLQDHASDFLEIFKELAKEPNWDKKIYQDLIEAESDEVRQISLREFIPKHIKLKTQEFLENSDFPIINEIDQLFARISDNEQRSALLENFRSETELHQIINEVENLYILPKDTASLNNYIQDFDVKIVEFAQHLSDFSKENTELFAAFCSGKSITAAVTETVKETEPADFANFPADRGEEVEIKEISEEDKNLRWLLRDYLIHEIEELSKEVTEKVEKLVVTPGDEDAELVVLDNLKVLKDLGKIHKYDAIEDVSNDLMANFKAIFDKQASIPNTSGELIHTLLSQFTRYIDAVLDENEQDVLKLIEDQKNQLVEAISTLRPPDILLSFDEKEQLHQIFSEVNSLFISNLSKDYSSLLEDPENAELKNRITHHIDHLKYWYKVHKISGAQDVLDLLVNWINNPKQQEKLVRKQSQILYSFDALSKELFVNTPEQWTGYIEKLTLLETDTEPLDVTKSLKAFKDVTNRSLKAVVKALHDQNIAFNDIIKDHFTNHLNQVSENSVITGNDDLKQLTDHLISKSSELLNTVEDQQPIVREKLGQFLESLESTVSALPDKLAIGDLKERFEKSVLGSEAVTEVVPDTPVDKENKLDEETEIPVDVNSGDELQNTFQEEATKYLDNMENHINQLSDNLEDENELKQFGETVHALKSSAQIMDYHSVKELLEPFEYLIEQLVEKKVEMRKQFLTLSKKIVKNLRKQLDHKGGDPIKLIESILSYQSKYILEGEPPLVAKKKSKKSVPPASELAEPIPQKPDLIHEEIQERVYETPQQEESIQEPLLKLKEKDPELLEIFSNEASDNLDSIEKDLTLIEKFRHDKQTLQSLDHAIHEIRSAAKMLGFSEIGDLVDKFEELVELLAKKEADNIKEMIPSLRKVIQVVRELTDKHQVSQTLYDEADSSLSSFLDEINQVKASQKEDETTTKTTPIEEEIPGPSDLVIQSFIQEAREYLEDSNFLLMKIEKDPEDLDLVYRLMRTFHTLKGSASMVSQENLEKLAHMSEELVEKFRKDETKISQEACDLLFNVIDEMDYIISSLANGEEGKVKNSKDLFKSLESLTSLDTKKSSRRKKTPTQKTTKEGKETDGGFLTVTDTIESEQSSQETGQVRLRVEQIDSLLNEAAELVINHNQFKTQIDKFKGILPRMDLEGKNLQSILWQFDKVIKEQQQMMGLAKNHVQNIPVMEETQKNQMDNIQKTSDGLQKFYQNFSQMLQSFKDSGQLYEEYLQKVTRLSKQIHDEIIKARLVPIDILFQRFHRPMRDLAKKHGKKINLYIEGEQTELDRILAEKLYEPVLHILRNAIDHGIENPAERKKVKKSEEGLIKLSAQQERNYVSITIEDDGKGIDVDKIKSRAIELGFLTETQAKELAEREVFEFLLYSGFSTTKTVTELSGRGFGLDVVRNQIQKIKGDLRIYSVPGKGVRFLIRLPISLTVTQAMLVEVNKNIYAIPLLQVEETININPLKIKSENNSHYIKHSGVKVPVINLSNLLLVRGAKAEPISKGTEYPLIIIQDEGNRVGLLVNKILHREEVLIKSIGQGLDRVRYIIGGSILADGKVVLVLDVPQIVFYSSRLKDSTLTIEYEQAEEIHPEPEELPDLPDKPEREKQVIEGRKPMVLIVDDSLSVRKFLSGLLSKHKFDVEVAKNGNAGLEMLNLAEFDLLITDLEMPQLSGYELIEKIRAESRWEKLPIIVLTGRASKHIEDHALKLGANDYIIKPFKEEELIEKIFSFIDYKE